MMPSVCLLLAVLLSVAADNNNINSHVGMTDDIMNSRISAVKKRRSWEPYDFHHAPLKSQAETIRQQKRPNILFILADDLGFGDTSVPPFNTQRKGGGGKNGGGSGDWPCYLGGYLTPELEKMASKGLKLTNFHSAAPVCSPARGSIMTGLHAWRLGALNAYELGRDLSQRNGFLAQVGIAAFTTECDPCRAVLQFTKPFQSTSIFVFIPQYVSHSSLLHSSLLLSLFVLGENRA